ncbi:hypothetical protein EFA46_015820 (plasmid) [Halarchaeum sp. CBA1220]|uniref:hypothetical protein n=1 Tax=Halarchaeum sp. CBA1220 TaxID=1853682 RepID=UPI000F3A8FCC|nr:hypothetical protein [Halarchaeum sp. CBA1220]QLC35721.1 hypothetical protein EFA46_015820 [Halarchaeum sp. CBA1220]
MAPFSDPTDPRPPLPNWVQQAYLVLEKAASGSPPQLEYAEAVERVERDGTLELERSDAEHAVERLLERGYLYKVDESLRITGSLETPSDAVTDEDS